MSRTLKFKSDTFKAIYGSVAGMFRAGTIDKAIMRRFAESCLDAPMEPAEITHFSKQCHPGRLRPLCQRES